MSERDTIAPDTCGKDGRPRDEICRVTCADSCPFNRPKTTIKRRERASEPVGTGNCVEMA